MKRLLAFLILTVSAFAQSTTTVTGTVKDLSNAVVTAGQVTFDLKPGLDTTISGAARFSPSTVVCTINGSGLIKALDGVSACVVTQNTSLTPAGTYYKVCLQPYSITPGSCFNWYALSASFDITTAVPTPGTMPAFTFVDLNSNQVITGVKTHTGIPVFSAGISGTAGQTLALPSSADTLVGRNTTDTMSFKTFIAPVLGAATGTSLALGGDTAMSNSPRMTFGGFQSGNYNAGFTIALFTPDKSITVTRVQVTGTVNTACTVNPTLVVSGTGTITVILTTGTFSWDSGAVSQAYTGGSPITIGAAGTSGTCATPPANINVIVQYRMQ